MPLELEPPSFGIREVYWDLHVDGVRGVRCATPMTAVKSALGLRPRAREDETMARKLARNNWAAFELIGRDAIASGRAKLSPASKDWRHIYDIDRETFAQFFQKYADQIVMTTR